MFCARAFTCLISFRLCHNPSRECLFYDHFINEAVEIKKLSSLPKAAAVWELGGSGPPGPLCFIVGCPWQECLGTQLSAAFPIPAHFSLPFRSEPWSGWDCILRLGVVCFPQLYGRHKEYLNSLVGTDFEMVSSPASCTTISWLSVARAL